MELKTWEDLEKAAIGLPWSNSLDMTLIMGEPLLRMAVTAVQLELMSKEQALIQLVFGLVDIKNHQHRQILDLLNTRPFNRLHLLPADPGA